MVCRNIPHKRAECLLIRRWGYWCRLRKHCLVDLNFAVGLLTTVGRVYNQQREARTTAFRGRPVFISKSSGGGLNESHTTKVVRRKKQHLREMNHCSTPSPEQRPHGAPPTAAIKVKASTSQSLKLRRPMAPRAVFSRETVVVARSTLVVAGPVPDKPASGRRVKQAGLEYCLSALCQAAS